MLIECYPEILRLHITSVALSGALFLLRGLWVQVGHKAWALASPLRYLSYAIDTVLLASALTLVFILPWAVFANGWLWVKIVLVVVYVLLGTLAMKRGRSPRMRGVCYVLALATFVIIIGIALAHQPLGWLYIWFA